MKKEIKYIGFYDLINSKYTRVSALSAISKMNYVAEAINDAGYNVKIISPSWYTNKSFDAPYTSSKSYVLDISKKLLFSPSFGTKGKLAERVKIIISLVWLFFWLLKHSKEGEKILVYHSPWLALPVILASKIRRFIIILEIEELYQKVWEINSILRKWENKLIDHSFSYILVSDLLAKYLPDKGNIILYGSYKVPKKQLFSRTNDIIKIVYAGSVELLKGGAFQIVETMSFLPSNYQLHILGYGDLKIIEILKSVIRKKNTELGRTACIYEGVKSGNDFSAFLQNCHIGVNPQYEGNYMSTAFPSKVLTYLTHNLFVVSTKIQSIIDSEIGPEIYFSENDFPEEIAKTILKIPLGIHKDNRELISRLNIQFINNLKLLFKDDYKA
jgi:hypothetical protein